MRRDAISASSAGAHFARTSWLTCLPMRPPRLADDCHRCVHEPLRAVRSCRASADLLPRRRAGGCIGTGLFVGAGGALANGGPLGLWLGYSIMGWCVPSSLLLDASSSSRLLTFLPSDLPTPSPSALGTSLPPPLLQHRRHHDGRARRDDNSLPRLGRLHALLGPLRRPGSRVRRALPPLEPARAHIPRPPARSTDSRSRARAASLSAGTSASCSLEP